MSVQNVKQIAHCVHYFVQSWAILQTSNNDLSQSECNMENRLFHVDHMTVEILSTGLHELWTKIFRSSVKKWVWKNTASWWRCNRAMWENVGRGSELAYRECVCTIEPWPAQRHQRLAGNRWTDTRTDGRTPWTDGRTDRWRRKHSILEETTDKTNVYYDYIHLHSASTMSPYNICIYISISKYIFYLICKRNHTCG